MKYCTMKKLRYYIKNCLVSVFLCSSFGVLNGQERFSVRNNLDHPCATFTSISVLPDGYLAQGIVCDSVYSNYTPLVYAKFSDNGELLNDYFYGGSYGNTEFPIMRIINPDMAVINDSLVIGSGYGFKHPDFGGGEFGLVLKYNHEQDFLEIIEFPSPYLGQDYNNHQYITTRGSILTTDSAVITTSGVVHQDYANTTYFNKHSLDGELLWEVTYDDEYNLEFNECLISDGEGGAYAIVHHIFPEPSRFRILHLSAQGSLTLTGTLMSNWLENEHFHNVNRFLTIDNELYSLFRSIDMNTSSSAGTADNFITLLKHSYSGDKLWQVHLTPQFDSSNNHCSELIETGDGNLLAAYYVVNVFEEGGWADMAVLTKVDLEGNVLWTRNFWYEDMFQYEHQVHDVQPTSDGGFVFCGDSHGAYEEGDPTQYGWIVKVDEYGCLVEGCHLSDNIQEHSSATEEEYFRASPNPASDFLNVFQSQSTSVGASYQLTDLNGQLLEEFQVMQKGTTTMLDVSGYPSGTYLLTLIENRTVLQQKKVILQ